MANLNQKQIELIKLYSKLAKKITDGQLIFSHVSIQREIDRIVKIKQGFQEFIKNPNQANFREFWNKELVYAVQQASNASNLLNRKGIKKIGEVMKQINIAKKYNPKWEDEMGARNSLREFWSKLKAEPIQNGCAYYGLSFFGYPEVKNYDEFIKIYADFKKEYLKIVSKRIGPYPIEVEIDQLFNAIDKTKLKELKEASDLDINKLCIKILLLKTQNALNEKMQSYLAYINKDINFYFNDEDYKFKVVADFQNKFKLDASDFGVMLDEALLTAKNLIESGNYYPRRMLATYYALKPDETRQAFVDLLDESKEIKGRLNDFVKLFKSIHKEAIKTGKIPEDAKNTYIDYRFVSFILSAIYPEKYFYTKFSEYYKLIAELNLAKNISEQSDGDKFLLFNSFGLLIREFLKGNRSFLDIHKQLVKDSQYKDSSLSWGTWDFIFNYIRRIAQGDNDLINYWIFQGNPNRFDVIGFLKRGGKEDWSMNQGRDDVQIGDKVYFWISGEEAGLYGTGEILTNPVETQTQFGNWHVDVKANNYLGDNYIPRQIFLDNKILKKSRIIKQPQGTNFLLTKMEEEEIEKIINKDKIIKNNKLNNDHMKQPKNLILYGPPGTGKTYQAIEKAKSLLSDQAKEETEEERIGKIIKELTWLEIVGVIMRLRGEDKYRVPELINDVVAKAAAKLRNRITKLNPTFWGLMQLHSNETSETVNFAKRSGLNLFDKGEQSMWYLTDTGKEYFADDRYSEIIKQLENIKTEKKDWKEYYDFITFHQSYSYEEFIEGIRPVLEDEEEHVRYELKDGIFKRMCRKAEQDPDNNYLLIIDEINRGNISKIFGELLTLVEEDKRADGANEIVITLPYSGQEFCVPSNLYILGTMNTADRSIALLDVALRRRFKFEELMPEYKDTGLDNLMVNDLNLGKLLRKINSKIEVMIDRDHQIGHSYFMKIEKNNKELLHDAWYGEIVPLLQEYFYNDWAKLELILGKYNASNQTGFIEVKDNSYIRGLFSNNTSEDYIDSLVGSVHKYKPEELIKALENLL